MQISLFLCSGGRPIVEPVWTMSVWGMSLELGFVIFMPWRKPVRRLIYDHSWTGFNIHTQIPGKHH